MSKDSSGLRERVRARFVRGGVQRRGGFEGPREVGPPTPDQFPKVIVVDGVTVEPEVVLPEGPAPPSDAEQAPETEQERRPDVLGAVLELAKEVAAGDSGRLGLGPADFRGFDPNRHGALDAYLARLMKGGEEEIVSKMLKDEDGRP